MATLEERVEHLERVVHDLTYVDAQTLADIRDLLGPLAEPIHLASEQPQRPPDADALPRERVERLHEADAAVRDGLHRRAERDRVAVGLEEDQPLDRFGERLARKLLVWRLRVRHVRSLLRGAGGVKR